MELEGSDEGEQESPFSHPFNEAKEASSTEMEIVNSNELAFEDIDTSCLTPWERVDPKFLEESLLQLSKSEPKCSSELVQNCFYLLDHDTLCISSLLFVENVLDTLITTHAAPFLTELLLLVVIPHFPELSIACETHFEPIYSLRSSLLSLLLRLRVDSVVTSRESWLALLGLSALMTEELWKKLDSSAEFSQLFSVCQQWENDGEHEQICKLCFLATCCRFVEVSKDEIDASEACLEVS